MIYLEIGILLFVGLSLLVYGFYAVFKTKFFIELNYRLSGSPSYFKSLIEKRWFNINIKLCGTLVIIVALGITIRAVYIIMTI